MTDYGDGIIERLPDSTTLQDKNNPFHKLINYGLGGWLDNFDNDPLAEQIFLETATGKWLDVHGKQFGIQRKPDETDDDYRERIVYESLGHVTIPFLTNVYDVLLYCYVEDYDPTDNTLTSDNPYACNHFMGVASDEVKSILSKKFVIGGELVWLTL